MGQLIDDRLLDRNPLEAVIHHRRNLDEQRVVLADEEFLDLPARRRVVPRIVQRQLEHPAHDREAVVLESCDSARPSRRPDRSSSCTPGRISGTARRRTGGFPSAARARRESLSTAWSGRHGWARSVPFQTGLRCNLAAPHYINRTRVFVPGIGGSPRRQRSLTDLSGWSIIVVLKSNAPFLPGKCKSGDS